MDWSRVRNLFQVLLLLSLPLCIAEDTNPVRNYCKRFGHQSTLKDGKIYIDGGTELFTQFNDHGAPTTPPIFGYNDLLLRIDMTVNWAWNTTAFQIGQLPKTGLSQTGGTLPLVQNGALYAGGHGDRCIYLFGGTTSYVNTSSPGYRPPGSPNSPMWSIDPNQDPSVWNEISHQSLDMSAVSMPNSGAYVDASDQSLAFYLGGQIGNGSSSITMNWDSTRYMITGLLEINTSNHTARNISTDGLSRFPRTRGSLTYIPYLGSAGILVALGGIREALRNSSDSGSSSIVPFQTVDVYDIASKSWYQQDTSGMIPQARMDFCVVYAPAADNSSHQLWLYGGRDSSRFHDDVYVLSIPSFTWAVMFTGYSPRAFHTCHLVGKSQILTIGGTVDINFTNGCDWETMGVAIYDMNDNGWGSAFNVSADEYRVPYNVSKVIGGGPGGNATMKAPQGGFNNAGLKEAINQPRTIQAGPSPQAGPNVKGKSGLTKGASIGTGVGVSVFGIIVILVFIVWAVKQHRRRQRHPDNKRPESLAQTFVRRVGSRARRSPRKQNT